jgi:hypothetical protein
MAINRFLLEDGVSLFLMEDGTSYYLDESSTTDASVTATSQASPALLVAAIPRVNPTLGGGLSPSPAALSPATPVITYFASTQVSPTVLTVTTPVLNPSLVGGLAAVLPEQGVLALKVLEPAPSQSSSALLNTSSTVLSPNLQGGPGPSPAPNPSGTPTLQVAATPQESVALVSPATTIPAASGGTTVNAPSQATPASLVASTPSISPSLSGGLNAASATVHTSSQTISSAVVLVEGPSSMALIHYDNKMDADGTPPHPIKRFFFRRRIPTNPPVKYEVPPDPWTPAKKLYTPQLPALNVQHKPWSYVDPDAVAAHAMLRAQHQASRTAPREAGNAEAAEITQALMALEEL